MTDVLETWAVQDSPPGAAITALVARGDVEVGWLDRAIYEERTVVALYNARSATAIVPAADVAAYATAQLPADESEFSLLLKNALGDYEDGPGARHRGDQRRARRARAQPRRPARRAAEETPRRVASVVRRLPEPPRPARAADHGRVARAAMHLRPGRAPARVLAHRPTGEVGPAVARGGRAGARQALQAALRGVERGALHGVVRPGQAPRGRRCGRSAARRAAARS